MLRLWIQKDGITTFALVEPKRDAFGRYKTKDYINTEEGRIERRFVTQIENVDEPWVNENEED